MKRRRWRFCLGFLPAGILLAQAPATQQTLTWEQTKAQFRANNPSLLAGKVTIDEARADEVTAYLRPNPNVNLFFDQITPYAGNHGLRPIWQSYPSGSIDYLHERQHKRELRLLSTQNATAATISAQNDLERNLVFSLRDAFVRVLLAKAVLSVSRENLDYYDKEIAINRERFNSGAIARVDFQRVELQRAQFASDLQTAMVNLRTAKIDLLALLRNATPVDQFDVAENFDFADPVSTLPDLHSLAIANRPDLKSAEQALEKAQTDHRLAVANGSTDPTFSVNGSRQAEPLNTYFGVGVSIPLRIFDRNQGEKARTQLEVTRAQRLRDQAEITTMHDVDSAYAALQSALVLLHPYRETYLKEADEIRSTVSFAYTRGAASLIEFLDAQKQYRDTQLAYLNLVGACFAASNQVNFSVGREVIQ